MLPSILYLATGLVTAMHLYVLLTLSVMGAPRNALEWMSLCGSLCLYISSYISLFRPQTGARLALPGALLSWSFYGPAIVATVSAGRHREITDPRIAALPYIALSLLAFATVYSAIVNFRRTEGGDAGSWFAPHRVARTTRRLVVAVSLTVLIAITLWVGFGRTAATPRVSKFLIPDGYVGWVKVEFQVPGTPAVPIDGGRSTFRIPAHGLLQTSSAEHFGSNNDEYFYYAPGDLLRRLSSRGSSGRMVWAHMNGQAGTAAASRDYEQFFVGTEEQFRNQASDARIGAMSSSTVAK